MWLTLAAMRNGIAILMASLAIVLLGATSLGRMPIDLFPNLNYPSLQVGTIYKGASAQDIERSVTYPIEKAVSAVANVRYVESRSRQGFSAVTVQFAWGADIDAGLTEVVQRIQAILSTLPVGIQQPFILKFDLSNIPVCILTVFGGGLWLTGGHAAIHQTGAARGRLRARLDRLFAWSGRMLEGLDVFYQRCLNWSLDHRKALIGG